ncbi:unnamed protein product, partial [marine sediment metagenome]
DLDKLENLQEFYNEVRKIIRNLGKSNMLNKSEIEGLLKEYK